MTEHFRPLYHHDSRDYHTAATDAARFARDKLERMIGEGQAKARQVITDITQQVPRDRVVKGNALQFGYEGGEDLVITVPGESRETLHRNAFTQVLGRAGIPTAFARNLEQRGNGWAHELMAHNLNTIYRHSTDRHLLRSLDGSLRGFLSDRYRRLDSATLVDSFAQGMQAVKAVPVEGRMLDTKVFLKAMLPVVYEPVPNEIVAFGLQWENSDFGNGAHNLRMFVLRLWCTNYAIGSEGIRQIHIGKRLSEDMEFSQKTYDLDTQATASAIQDVVRGSLSEERVQLFLNGIKEAHEEKIDPKVAIADLRKRLTKGEVDKVVEVFNSPDVENLPAGNSRWRLSNALSWIAGQTEDPEKSLEFEREAGRLVPQLAA